MLTFRVEGDKVPLSWLSVQEHGQSPSVLLFLVKQHHLFAAREERGHGGCPSAGLGIPPWSSSLCCPGSHWDIPDLQTLLQPW